jgi:uncharacterized protein GlcG (DUF336 family)
MLDFDSARRLAGAALAEGGRRRSAPLTVAVLDAGGHLIVLYRQTGSGIARPQIATGKAWGALGPGFSSRGVAGAASRFPEFFAALAAATGSKVIPAPGGVLPRNEGQEIVGAVGISGDNSDIDEACGILAARSVGLDPEPGRPVTSRAASRHSTGHQDRPAVIGLVLLAPRASWSRTCWSTWRTRRWTRGPGGPDGDRAP